MRITVFKWIQLNYYTFERWTLFFTWLKKEIVCTIFRVRINDNSKNAISRFACHAIPIITVILSSTHEYHELELLLSMVKVRGILNKILTLIKPT